MQCDRLGSSGESARVSGGFGAARRGGEDGGHRRAQSFLRDHNRANAILPHKNTMRPPDGGRRNYLTAQRHLGVGAHA